VLEGEKVCFCLEHRERASRKLGEKGEVTKSSFKEVGGATKRSRRKNE